MDIFEICLLATLLILFVIIIYYYAKCKKRFSKIIFGFCSGIAFLFPAKLILGYFGYQLSINIITLAISSIIGIPGVAIIVAMSIL